MNLPKNYQPQKIEKKILKFWEREKIFKFEPRKRGEFFSVDTPPPTVSGKMHLGHFLSYTQQDAVVRYHRMKGENVFYPFGTDDNGLPTERLVEKLNKVRIFDIDRNEFIKLCRKTLKKIVPEFIRGWRDIAMSCDFELYYSTISKDVQKLSQKFFIELYKKKRAYRKESPTLWCPQCQTAIAQADLEDKERKGFLNYIKVNIIGTNEYIVFATTRPELLPACVGVSVHPDDKRYKKFIGMKVEMPITGAEIPIIPDEKTDMDYGTGVVYYCTYGGVECIDWMQRHPGIKAINIIGPDGKYSEKAGKYAGLVTPEARERILADLKKIGALAKQEPITHIVNTHERCGTDVEFVTTKQWFIRYLDLKQDFLKMGREIKWHPVHMRKRYENWVEGLRWDWCISRQRYFGIPFPLWYCRRCGKIKLARISDLPVDPLHSKPKIKCSCGSNEFIPEKDVLDTWATSSLTPQIAIELLKDRKLKKKLFPMSLRPQAHDIINFWLFYAVARSKLHFNRIPFKDIMISGFVLDPHGEKMSKSKGNVVAPQEVIPKYGVDVLRHWATKAGLGEDLRWNEEEIKASKRTVIKIWNASRFCFLHLKDFSKKRFGLRNLKNEDRWLLHLLQETIENYDKEFKKYEFKKAKETLENFFWKSFCDNYLELVKPRLYDKKTPKETKDGAKFTLYLCLLSILKLYAPFLPFITEELFRNYFRLYEKERSIHLSSLPEPNPAFFNNKVKKDFNELITLIAAIRKYKSGKKISLKKELKKLSIQTDNKELKKELGLLKSVMNIRAVEIKKSGPPRPDYIEVNPSIRIKIDL